MNNSNGNQFNKFLEAVSSFFKKGYAYIRLFLKKAYTSIVTFFKRSYASILFFFKNLKNPTQSEKEKRIDIKKIASKGIFGFNVAYGVIKTVFISLAYVLGLLGFLGAGLGLGFFVSLIDKDAPPSREVMAEAINSVELVSSFHYYGGENISEVRTDLHRTVIDYDQISPHIIDGITATEDEYFYEHDGIVPKAVLRALITQVTGAGETTGGSTLTQQLIKQQVLTDDVTFSRKANEILLAMRLENFFGKEDIITAYLNVSPFGRNSTGVNIAGIEEAALGIFNVHANEVNIPQAAFLVGLPQNPYIYTPYSNVGEIYEDNSEGLERMKTVLSRMFEEQKITQEEYDDALAYDIQADFKTGKDPELDNHNFLYQQVEKQAIETLMAIEAEKNGLTFEEIDADVELYNDYYFRNESYLTTGGLKVYSSVDKDIYEAMQEAVAGYGPYIGETYIDTYQDEETGETKEIVELAQTGSVLLENATGRILGFIGGVDFSTDQNDHAFDSPRSPASTIKPLAVYAPAIEMNLISPASMLPDTPMGEEAYDPSTGETWQVSNIGGVISNQLVTARKALYDSMNNPTGKLYIHMLNNDMEPYKYMDMMDYKYIDDNKQYPAFSLGTTNVTVAEQTTAFATFANHGDYIPSYLIEKIEDNEGTIIYQHEVEKREVFSDQTAYLTLDILRDVINLGFSNRINNFLNFDADLAAKTGTSDENTDYWFIGSTPTVTLSSWIGYNNQIEKHRFYDPNFTGWPSSDNMQYWSAIANNIYATSPETLGVDQVHERPGGIIEESVVARTGTLPGNVTLPDSSTTVKIDGEKRTDLFKETNPPKEMTYDFAPAATYTDLRIAFWDAEENRIREAEAAARRKAEEEAQRKANEAKNNRETTTPAKEDKKPEKEDKEKKEDEKKEDKEKEDE